MLFYQSPFTKYVSISATYARYNAVYEKAIVLKKPLFYIVIAETETAETNN